MPLRLFLPLLSLALSFSLAQSDSDASASIPHLFDPLIASKVSAQSKLFQPPPSGTLPQLTTPDTGVWISFVAPNTWTSGFFPATLYELKTRNSLCPSQAKGVDWLGLGRVWSGLLQQIVQVNTVQHDVGFISFPFQAELALNPTNQSAIDSINKLATSLAARFSPIVGCTRSWDTSDPTDFQVIIDNMVNLGLFYASAKLTGNTTMKDMAVSHADKTIANHIRPDGSSFHVVEYNSTTGAVIRRRTSQGFADNSTWTRGQAWGIVGFSNMYINSGLTRYLDTARRMATFFLLHTPPSFVIPWDFDAPGSPPASDTSAAMIAANGMLLLSTIESRIGNSTGSSIWINAAIRLMGANSNFGWRPSWQSILANGTANMPARSSMTGLVYGDYYFVKNGNMLVQMGLARC